MLINKPTNIDKSEFILCPDANALQLGYGDFLAKKEDMLLLLCTLSEVNKLLYDRGMELEFSLKLVCDENNKALNVLLRCCIDDLWILFSNDIFVEHANFLVRVYHNIDTVYKTKEDVMGDFLKLKSIEDNVKKYENYIVSCKKYEKDILDSKVNDVISDNNGIERRLNVRYIKV